MDGTGTADDQKPIRPLLDDFDCILSAIEDCTNGAFRLQICQGLDIVQQGQGVTPTAGSSA